MIPFRGEAEIAGRLEVVGAARVLLVDPPAALEEILRKAASPGQEMRAIEAGSIRKVKDAWDLIVLWQESRVGSRALFEAAVKRLAPGGSLWVVTALKKVKGPSTPAIHRLEPGDVSKAFAKAGLVRDRVVRLSAWHEAHRFVRREAKG
jgi:hypothetical protein